MEWQWNFREPIYPISLFDSPSTKQRQQQITLPLLSTSHLLHRNAYKFSDLGSRSRGGGGGGAMPTGRDWKSISDVELQSRIHPRYQISKFSHQHQVNFFSLQLNGNRFSTDGQNEDNNNRTLMIGWKQKQHLDFHSLHPFEAGRCARS